MKTEAWETLDLLFDDLVGQSKEYLPPEKRSEFEQQVGLTLLIIETLLADPVNIFKDLSTLLEKSEEFVIPEKKQEFTSRVKLALLKSKIALIEGLSKEANAHYGGVAGGLATEWRELRSKAEVLIRRLQLLSPPTVEDFEATLRWMAEQGGEDDLGLMCQVKRNPPYTSPAVESLFEIVEKRMRSRLTAQAEELRIFFGLTAEELEQITSGDADPTLETLRLVKESLEALFKPEEIRRWLQAPNPRFDGKSPRSIVIEGEAKRILEVLVGLEEGIHN